MTYCSGCGRELPPGARFCPACGRTVHTGAAPTMNYDGLTRPRAGRKIAGVCVGLAQRYGWDVALTRLGAVLVGLFTFPLGVIAYIVMWIMLPEEPYLLNQPATGGPTTGV